MYFRYMTILLAFDENRTRFDARRGRHFEAPPSGAEMRYE